MKTHILGVGNPILMDDGVGIKSARKLKEENPDLEVTETSEVGVTLLDLVVGYDRLIIIDSIKTENGRPGKLYEFELEHLNPTLELGQRLGNQMSRYVLNSDLSRA